VRSPPRVCPFSSDFLVYSKLEGTELGSVVGLIGAKHREQGVQEFTHYGYDRLETFFAAAEQAFIKTPQMRLAAQGYQRGHV
jgi:hypothetical protein